MSWWMMPHRSIPAWHRIIMDLPRGQVNSDMGIRWVHMGIECIVKEVEGCECIDATAEGFVCEEGWDDACMQYKKNQKL